MMANRTLSQIVSSDAGTDVLTQMASNYCRAYDEAHAQEAEFDTPFDGVSVLEEACHIDTALLPPGAKQRVCAAVGEGKFDIKSDNLYIERDIKYEDALCKETGKRLRPTAIKGVYVVDTSVPGRRIKHFVPDWQIEAAQGASGSSAAPADKQVVVRIKTGRGGWEYYHVAASAAKDMGGE
jgi:hypothetical protein